MIARPTSAATGPSQPPPAKFRESESSPIGGALVLLVLVALVVLAVVMNQRAKRRQAEAAREAYTARFSALVQRFGPDAANAITQRRLFQGATFEMVREMFGPPAVVDERVLKTKTVHTMKYHPRSHNSFGLLITIENGFVTGWETKH
jgi:hypothetical protein